MPSQCELRGLIRGITLGRHQRGFECLVDYGNEFRVGGSVGLKCWIVDFKSGFRLSPQMEPAIEQEGKCWNAGPTTMVGLAEKPNSGTLVPRIRNLYRPRLLGPAWARDNI